MRCLFTRRARRWLESETARRALPFGVAILCGIGTAWAAPRAPFLINALFLLLALGCGIGAVIAFAYALLLRGRFERGEFVGKEARQSAAQTASFVAWFIAHDLAWASCGWFLAFLLNWSLGAALFGRAATAGFAAAGFVFLGAALDAVRYALYHRKHFGIGWARPSPRRISNLIHAAAATLFLAARYKSAEAQDLASKNGLLNQYVALEGAIASKANELAGVRVHVQPDIGKKESFFHGSAFGVQALLALVLAWLILSFDAAPPVPLVYPPGSETIPSTNSTVTRIAENSATETSRAANGETSTPELEPSRKNETSEPNHTPSPENGTPKPNQTPSPENGTPQPNQTPSPENGTPQPNQTPSPSSGTQQAEQTPSPGNGTEQPNQTPSPGNGIAQPNQTPSPDNGTGQPNQTPSPSNGTVQPNPSPSPGEGTAQPNQTPSPGNGTGQPNQTPSPSNGTAQPNQTPSPGNSTGQPNQTPSSGNGAAQPNQKPSPDNDAAGSSPTAGNEGATPSVMPTSPDNSGTLQPGQATAASAYKTQKTSVPPPIPHPPRNGTVVTIAAPTPKFTRNPTSSRTGTASAIISGTPTIAGTLLATPAFTPGATQQSSSNPLQFLPNWILTLFQH